MQLLSQGLRQCGHLVSVDGMAGAFGVLRFNERIIGMSDSCLSAREHLSGGTSFASLRNNHFAERVKIEVKLPLSPTGSFYIDSTAGVLPQFAERRSTHGNASISGSSSQAAAVKSSLSVGNLGQHESHFRDHMVAKSLMMQRMQVAGLQTSAAPSLGQRALEDDASHNHDDHDIMDEGDRASTQLQHLKENNLETDEGNTAVTQPGELEGAVESTKRHFNPMPLTPPLHREECALFDEGGGKQAPVHVPSSVAGPIWWQLPEMEALRLPPRFMEQAKVSL